MRILLVDDSATMRFIQRTALAALGTPEIVEAGDGAQALATLAAATVPFDLIVTDWNMPNMNGPTFVAQVRQTNRHTPIIMCTTESEKSRIMVAIKAGVNNYVTKPFTAETFIERIKSTLDKARAA